jgi:hypothetical protein
MSAGEEEEEEKQQTMPSGKDHQAAGPFFALLFCMTKQSVPHETWSKSMSA